MFCATVVVPLKLNSIFFLLQIRQGRVAPYLSEVYLVKRTDGMINIGRTWPPGLLLGIQPVLLLNLNTFCRVKDFDADPDPHGPGSAFQPLRITSIGSKWYNYFQQQKILIDGSSLTSFRLVLLISSVWCTI